jgi:Inward rectifier potassium channel C-terminal domain/Ion channel
MSLFTKHNQAAAKDSNTGFGTNASSYGGRLLNKDGSPNIKKTGVGILERYSWFHSMLNMGGLHFFIIIFLFYISVNLLFTIIYYLIGTEHLIGINVHTEVEKFTEAFFFSAQTFTTVGYGRISPQGFTMSAVSSFQALVGLLSFAVATGLMYGRFSLPKAYIKFSEKALITPYEDITGLMIRLAPFKKTSALTDVEAKVTLALIVEENGKFSNQFFTLGLEAVKINALALSWTLVHPINEESPIYNFTQEDFLKANGEILIYIKAFDDTFSNSVIARTSYTFDEVAYGYKFRPMYNRDDTGQTTVLHLEKLNECDKVPMP